MQSEAWRALHQLPHVLMAEAKEASYSAPTKAAVRAQMAVAIGILNFAPIRRGNLGTIRISENLHSNRRTANALSARLPEL